MFIDFKLTKELTLLFTFGVISFLYFAFPGYYGSLHIQAQLLQQQQQRLPPIISIKITSPVTNQVPVGELTISGTSTDNATTDCTVYADWNNTKPFQKAIAIGPGGVNDYSKWTFTYTDKYHLITNGTNNLTSKLSCFSDVSNSGTTAANITKSYSINVIGVMEPSQRQVSSSGAAQQQNNLSGSISSSPLPPVMEDNNTDTTTPTSPESIPSVPITPSPSLPSIQEQKPEGNDNVVQKEVEPQTQSAPRDNSGTTIYWDIQ
jgi:hypothetical protein